jgi:hypothetical protein
VSARVDARLVTCFSAAAAVPPPQVWQPLERMEPTGVGVDRATGTLYVAGKLRCVSALSALPPFDLLRSLTGGTHDTMIDWPKGLCVDAPRGLLFVGFEAHVGVFRTLT